MTKPCLPIRIEIIELPYVHHGGAWKVAYADFVTAMMAFFLLMWLLNVTTQEQKDALSDYFNPSHPMVSDSKSGSGGVLGGLTMSPEGAMASNKNPLIPMQATQQRKRGGEVKSKVNQAREKAQQKRFEDAALKIQQAIAKNEALKKLADNIAIDITPEGLRIQIIDQEDEAMFAPGSARLFERTEILLREITKIILEMPNELSIRGHTDASRYAADAPYTNWELSADRANASRRVILSSGMPTDRLSNVMGKADTSLLITDDPLDPRNRRISLILLNEDFSSVFPPDADDLEQDDGDFTQPSPNEPRSLFEKTPGAVEFP